ncbi:MAG TPA: Wzz/FepE/Etk N-terminal domain-containing protein, partial [bacterium]|nr:Wzz/FepE/Etk N-terminal domain-containing protein [bacterium]
MATGTDRTPTVAQSEVLRDLLSAVYRRRPIFGIAVLITTVVATIFSLVRPPVYEASSTVIADKTPPLVLLPNPGGQSSLVQQPLAQAPDAFTLAELVKSEAVRDGATS